MFGADVSVAALKMLFVGVIAGDCNKYDPTQAIVMGDEILLLFVATRWRMLFSR